MNLVLSAEEKQLLESCPQNIQEHISTIIGSARTRVTKLLKVDWRLQEKRQIEPVQQEEVQALIILACDVISYEGSPYKVTPAQAFSRSRSLPAVWARSLVMCYLRNKRGQTLTHIGSLFKRHHCAVISIIRNYSQFHEFDKEYAVVRRAFLERAPLYIPANISAKYDEA